MAGQGRVTASDIAREAGVSRATVGFVLNRTPGQTISPETQQRVREAAQRLDYRPHRGAQALARGSSRVVVFVLPDWPLESAIRQLIDAMAATLRDSGYGLVTQVGLDGSPRPLWEMLDAEVVWGLVPFTPEQIRALRRQGVRHVGPAVGDDPPWTDTTQATQVDHLAARGCRRIAYVALKDERLAELDAAREAGVRTRCAELGLPEPVVVRVDATDGRGPELARRLRTAGVDGVAAYNDTAGAFTLASAARAGVSVPRELRVIGVDDSPLTEVTVPTLSSMTLPNDEFGRFVAQRVLAVVSGASAPPAPVVAASVVERESTEGVS